MPSIFDARTPIFAREYGHYHEAINTTSHFFALLILARSLYDKASTPFIEEVGDASHDTRHLHDITHFAENDDCHAMMISADGRSDGGNAHYRRRRRAAFTTVDEPISRRFRRRPHHASPVFLSIRRFDHEFKMLGVHYAHNS